MSQKLSAFFEISLPYQAVYQYLLDNLVSGPSFVPTVITALYSSNIKSPIKDVNKCLNGIRNCFNPLHSLFFPGSRIADHFSSRINFHSPFSFDENLHQYLQSLNLTFRSSQINHNSAAVIVDEGVKKSYVATAAAYVWSNNLVIKKLQVYFINVTPLEAELMAIYTGLVPAMKIDDIHDITVITDSITTAKKILKSKVAFIQQKERMQQHPLQMANVFC